MIGTGLVNLYRLSATFLAGAAVGVASLLALVPIQEPDTSVEGVARQPAE